MLKRLVRRCPVVKHSQRWGLAGNAFPRSRRRSGDLKRVCGRSGEKGQMIFYQISMRGNPAPLLLVFGKDVQNRKVATGICPALT